jgi:hypothetical protein
MPIKPGGEGGRVTWPARYVSVGGGGRLATSGNVSIWMTGVISPTQGAYRTANKMGEPQTTHAPWSIYTLKVSHPFRDVGYVPETNFVKPPPSEPASCDNGRSRPGRRASPLGCQRGIGTRCLQVVPRSEQAAPPFYCLQSYSIERVACRMRSQVGERNNVLRYGHISWPRCGGATTSWSCWSEPNVCVHMALVVRRLTWLRETSSYLQTCLLPRCQWRCRWTLPDGTMHT